MDGPKAVPLVNQNAGGAQGNPNYALYALAAGTPTAFHSTKQGDITAGYAILFAFCGFAYVLAFGISHLLAPKFAPVTELQ